MPSIPSSPTFLIMMATLCLLVTLSAITHHVDAFSSPRLLQRTSLPPSPAAGVAASTTRSTTLLHADADADSSSSPPQATNADMTDTYATCGSCGSSFTLNEDDLGPRGRRLECSVCGHTWFQSRNRIMSLSDGFEMIPLPDRDMERIQLNLEEGKPAKFTGDMKLYVGNISFDCSEDDLWDIFGSVGDVGEISLVRDDQGRNRGFGFVTMREQADGEKALEQLDGLDLKGRNLNVRESTT